MKASPKKSSKYYNIEAIRFIFSVFIVYYHIIHPHIIKFTGGSTFYEALQNNTEYMVPIVECFFILSGFFLYYSYYRKPDISVKEFVYNKASRLLPVLFVYEVIGLLFFNFKPFASLFNVLFLQCIGLSVDWQGTNWYISPMFWASVFYFVLLKCFKDKRKLNIFIGVIVYFSYMLLLNHGGLPREVIDGVFSGALLRALAGIGLGYLIAVCVESVKQMPSVRNFKPNSMQNVLISIVISLCELACFAYICIHVLFKEKAYNNQFIVVILFCALLLCMLTQKGILSRICNNKFIGGLGKYSYSIYVMQLIAIYILQRTLWQNADFVQHHALRCIAVSVLLIVLFGIAVYYIVEKPSARLLKKLGKKLFKKE